MKFWTWNLIWEWPKERHTDKGRDGREEVAEHLDVGDQGLHLWSFFNIMKMLMFLMLDTRVFTMGMMVMIVILSLEWFLWCHYTKLDEGSNDTDFVQIVMKIFDWTFEVPTSYLWNDHVIPHSGSARCLSRSSCHKYQLSDSSWFCRPSQFASFETQLSRWKKWEYKERQLAQRWCFWKHFW